MPGVLTRREWLAGATGALVAAARQPLNIVFILMDDMGWKDLACYGNEVVETPNADRLAREGMRFMSAYAACPVCSPTRASILTGKYPARLHVTDWIPGRRQWPTAKLLVPQFNQQLPLEENTIPELLKPAGYASASIGKWHLGGKGFSPETQGFDLNVAGDHRGSPATYFGPFNLPNLTGGTPDDHLADRLASEAIRFMEQNRQKPFFVYLPHFSVHIPLQARKQLIEHYQRKGAPEPVYAAMIHEADAAVGRVLRALDDLRLADRTLVVFNSDNGGLRYEGSRKQSVAVNAPLRAGKGHLYEGGIREPLIVRWPGVVKPGTTCDSPVSSVDFLPTFVEAAGVKPPGGIDGISIQPLLRGKTLKPRPLFWHYPHYSNQGGKPSSAVREGDWKLIEFLEDGRLELFHIGRDIGERENLVRREPRVAARLQKLLQDWRISVNAAMPQPNPNYDPAREDQGLTGDEPPTPPL